MATGGKARWTAADALRANGGVGPGFDALRLGLSLWVFTLHAMYIGRGVDPAIQFAANPLHRILLTPVLPMFFLVSGYLVTGSAIRTKAFSTFLLFRIFRIVPALAVEVALCALVLGPWLTEKSLAAYFSDPLVYRYFLNIVGYAHFFLPGLFTTNPITVVNANLWTLKAEFYCYAFMSVMIISGIVYNRLFVSIITAGIICLTVIYIIFGHHTFNFIGLVNWKFLLVTFALGMAAFHWNDWIVISNRNAIVAVALAVAGFLYTPALVVGLLALIYIVVYIGTKNIYLPPFLRNGDYSYGIYLFGFPIQQTLVYFLPAEYRGGGFILALGLPLTLAFAMLSWNLIEKPALRLKNRFKISNAGRQLAPDSRFQKAETGASVGTPDPIEPPNPEDLGRTPPESVQSR